MIALFGLCLLVMGYALVARRMAATILTAPMLFLCFGAGMSETGLIGADMAETVLHPVAEVALVVLLFLDAAQTDLGALRRI